MFARTDGLESIRELFEGVPCLVTVGLAWVEWDRLRPGDGNFGLKTLGSGSSVGLGLALALPHRKIAVLDGDGAVLMNVNGLVTLGRMQPRNLVHIVFDNKVYEASGCIPTATAYNVDLVALAIGAGIKNARRADSVGGFKDAVQRALSTDGPHFIVASIGVNHDEVMAYARLDEVDNKFRFIRYLEALEGRKLREDAIDVKLSMR